ncbi:HAD family hydrolase [Chitinivibrio alkaliphilus]|uniref:phosphoglycolate phosphatase n=1 Tax=Chitinivibrio alkaliphilus ACht1 TaxID=1313304 RepID=U7D8R9_9BACT|nr:HAD hydrolase-like protein [Chitinivibrio alkaliphilus]ERP39330.1 haloacid dehalogenase-like hydrolase [Chitinivibrio alkaliphilus ACht1]
MIIDTYETFLWDFNGTIIDDVWLCYEIYQVQQRKYNLRLLSLEEYRFYFTFPVQDFYTFAGFTGTKKTFTRLAGEFIALYREKRTECQLHEGVQSVLQEIQNQQKTSRIISAYNRKELEATLEEFGIRQYFSTVHGLESQTSGSKIEMARELCDVHNCAPEKTVLLGDTVHDYEVACDLGISAVLTTKGHNSRERLIRDCPKARIVESICHMD